jgi:(p)ppGpp synthase/HD superfamily hydrolase
MTEAEHDPDLLRNRLEVQFDRVSPKDAATLKSALKLAFRAHSGQTRDDGTPYVLHPLRVASLLMEEMAVCDSKVVCAALLHDVVEDNTTVTLEEIAVECGFVVGELVQVLTKPPKQGRTHAEINAVYFPRIAEYPDEAVRLVKLADRLDNVRDLVNCPDVPKRARMLMETQTFYSGLIDAVKKEHLKESFRNAYLEAIDLVKAAFP